MNNLVLENIEWKEFFIGGEEGLFDISSTQSGIDKNKLNLNEGKIPYITRSDMDNGINLFITEEQNPRFKIDEGNVISIGLDTQTVFYQENSFYTGQNIQVLRNDKLNKEVALFLIPLLEIQMQKFNWGGNGATLGRLNRTKILLPIDENGSPNWYFMEEYIKQEQKQLAQQIIDHYEQKMLETSFDFVGLEDVKWKVFKIQDIFEVKPVKGQSISKYQRGKTPYVTTSSQNNGVNDFVEADKNISDKNAISIDPIGGKAFLHEYDFVGRGGAGSAINLLYNPYLDKYNGRFICTAIENVSKEKASYGVQLNGNRLKNTKILLPVDKNDNPHWDYMSQFMQKIEAEKVEESLEHIYIYELALSRAKKIISLTEKTWAEFWLEDIVEITGGRDIYARERINGNTPYITATANNNGVGYFVDNSNKTLEENCISINRNGSVGYAFYHPYKALYGNDTRKLRLKYPNKYFALFLVRTIQNQKEKYGYGYKMGTARLQRQKIMLPVTGQGRPDFNYMKHYIQIEEIKQSFQVIKHFREII